ncbi:MAG: serine/threonine-protein kinase [Planctomycetes bacterium]|jgi:tetratricopeptide (TPR) repeat protein|nr:serine/threonine-protein kinase [Planctomycetota bacterium]
MSSVSGSGDRLERALEVFLAAAPSSPAEAERLLATHPELADLLRPMLDLEPDAPAAAAAGAELPTLGDFRLLRELGRGGMGIVYEAWQRSLDRRVAVKVLSPALVASPAAVARLRREASAAGRLRHPHIVEVFGFGSDGDRHFFAMQLVQGSPLHECAERFRQPARAVALAIQLTEALEHAHAHGLVHRDVKPANILVQADDTILLTDFGVARDEALPSLTREGGFLGTLDYASPEQVRGESVDARTDLWAVGVLLHELLSGSSPFAAPTQQALLHNILVAEPPPLLHRTGISADLAAVADHALAKDRDRRYASATALLADLRALRAGAPVSVRLPGRTERLRRWARREPWRAFAALVVAIGLPALAAAGGYLWANAPRIAAAAEVEAMQRREERLAIAWSELAAESPARGLEALAGMVEDPEVLVTRSWLLRAMGQREPALATLRSASGPTAALLLSHWSGDAEASAPLPTTATDDPFECFVRAQIQQEAGIRSGYADRNQARVTIGLLQRAILLCRTPRLTYLLTLLHNAVGDPEFAAIADATAKALETHFPDHPESMRARMRLYSETAPEQALAAWERIPADRRQRLHLEHGIALERLRRLDDAATAYRAAIAVDPTRRLAHTNLGLVLRKLGQHEAAIASLRHATELASNHPQGWNGLGLALRDAGRAEEAEAAFRRAMQIAPTYAHAPYNLGNLLLRRGDVQGAAEAFRAATEAGPDDVRNWANLGNALERAGNLQEALVCCLRATALAPEDFIPWHNLSDTARRLGLHELALSSARRALAVDSKRAEGHAMLADALLAATPVDATAALSAARAADERAGGKNLQNRLLVARALHASGDATGATTLLDELARAEAWSKAADQERITRVRQQMPSR